MNNPQGHNIVEKTLLLHYLTSKIRNRRIFNNTELQRRAKTRTTKRTKNQISTPFRGDKNLTRRDWIPCPASKV